MNPMWYVLVALLVINLYVSVLRLRAATTDDVRSIVRAESPSEEQIRVAVRQAVADMGAPSCKIAAWRSRLGVGGCE